MNQRTTDSTPPLDFSDRIRDLTQVFVGREWLLREVDDFLAQAQDYYLVITGEPGIGKSAVAARLTQVRDVHAFHLCQARRGGTLDPIEFVRSLGHQLVRRLPDFGRHVVEQKPVHIEVHIDVEHMQGGAIYGVYINEFVVQTRSADEAFQYLVREPLKAWAASCPPSGPVFLLVDALDEALRLDRHPNIVDLIDAARDLPDVVRWVLTSRPGEHLGVLPGARIVMLDDSAENMADVRAYVGAVLAEPQVAAALQSQGVDTATLGDELARRSGGNFLYLRYVLDGIRQDVADEHPVVAPEQLPVGLDGVYREFLDRVLARKPKDEWRQIYRPVLGVLAVAQDALDFDQLVTLSDVSLQGVNDVVTELDQFLDVAPGEAKTDDYRIYHTSFADFLTDRARNQAYWTDPKHHHRQIAGHYTRNYADCWPECNLYGLRYLPTHLAGAKDWTGLTTLLTDFNFMEAKCQGVSVYDLEADYQAALAQWGGAADDRRMLIAIEERLRLESHHIYRAPELLFPHLYNHLTWLDRLDQPDGASGPLHRLCEQALTQSTCTLSAGWLRMVQDPRPAPPPWWRSLEGHTGSVTAVAVTREGVEGGPYVVSGSCDKTVKVWDLKSGQLLRSLEGHIAWVRSVAVTSDGQQVVSGSWDHTIKVWDLESGQLLRTMEGHASFVNAVAVTSDGQQVVSGSYDSTVKVWDLESGKLLRTLEGSMGIVWAVAVTREGEGGGPYVVGGSEDNTVRVWDLQSGQLLCSLEGHTGRVWAVAVTSDGQQVVSGSYDKTVKVWDLESGQLLRSLEGHTGPVNAVAVTPDGVDGGPHVISGSWDHMVKVWELESGELLHSLEGHIGRVEGVAVIKEGVDGEPYVVSGSADSTVKVWNLKSGKLLRSYWVMAEAVTREGVDGRLYVVSGSEDRSIEQLHTLTGHTYWKKAEVMAGERSLEGHTGPVTAVAVTSDGQQVVSGSWDHTVKVWDLESGQLLRSLEGHTGRVWAVTVIKEGVDSGPYVVSGSEDETIKLWDLQSGQLLRSLEGHTGDVWAVAVTGEGVEGGPYLVGGSDDNTVQVWDLRSRQLLRSLKGQTHMIYVISVRTVAVTQGRADGGPCVVSGSSADSTVKVWDLESGKLLRSLEGHTGWVNAVAVTGEGVDGGPYVVSGSGDKTVKVWDLKSGQLLRSLEGHTKSVNAVAVTGEGVEGGPYVVSGSEDNTVRVWDLKSGYSCELFGNDATISCVALSSDGRWLTCGDTEGRVWIFEWVRQSNDTSNP